MLKSLGDTTPEMVPSVGASMQEYGDTAINKIFNDAVDHNNEKMAVQSKDTLNREKERGLQIASDVNTDATELASRKLDMEEQVERLERMGVYTPTQAVAAYNSISDEFNTTVVTAQYNADLKSTIQIVKSAGYNSVVGQRAIKAFTSRYENFHTDHSKTVSNTVPKIGVMQQASKDAGETSLYGDDTWFGERPSFLVPDFSSYDPRKRGSKQARKDPRRDQKRTRARGDVTQPTAGPALFDKDGNLIGEGVLSHTPGSNQATYENTRYANRASHIYNLQHATTQKAIDTEVEDDNAYRLDIGLREMGQGDDSFANHPATWTLNQWDEAETQIDEIGNTIPISDVFDTETVPWMNEARASLEMSEGDPDKASGHAYRMGAVQKPSRIFDDYQDLPPEQREDAFFLHTERTLREANAIGRQATGNESGKFGISEEALADIKSVIDGLPEGSEEQARYYLQAADMFLRLDPKRARDHMLAIAGKEKGTVITMLYQASTIQDDDEALANMYVMGLAAVNTSVEQIAANSIQTEKTISGKELDIKDHEFNTRQMIFGGEDKSYTTHQSVWTMLDEETKSVLLLQRGYTPGDANDQQVMEAYVGMLVRGQVDKMISTPGAKIALSAAVADAKDQVVDMLKNTYGGLQPAKITAPGTENGYYELILDASISGDPEAMAAIEAMAHPDELVTKGRYASTSDKRSKGRPTPDQVVPHIVDGVMYWMDIDPPPGVSPFIMHEDGGFYAIDLNNFTRPTDDPTVSTMPADMNIVGQKLRSSVERTPEELKLIDEAYMAAEAAEPEK
jgi:hypothetical protein